ncbi:hypothetical protein [Marinitoga lauensis]|uniref:hypothetical protein n=1 Tax=Marinitoga lauensis TaxID=2201189 RepID=UPI0010132633|nr:hypothetical protein [Marinitoga lauensis]
MDYRKKVKELFYNDIDELKYYKKLKKASELELNKNSILAFADNNKYQIYYTNEGKIYLKDISGTYLYIDSNSNEEKGKTI